MAGISNKGGPLYGGAVPFRSHQWLITRAPAPPHEIRLQIDPVDGGLDYELLNLIRAGAGATNNVRRLNKSTAHFQYGSSNAIPIIGFALICSLLVYYLRCKTCG